MNLFNNNLLLESIRNNQEIHICLLKNTPETPLTGSTFLLTIFVNTSENFVNISENTCCPYQQIICTKIDNYIDVKYNEVVIKYSIEKIVKNVKQQFSSCNQSKKINASRRLYARLRP